MDNKHIQMRGVRKTYQFFTLDDVSLELAPGVTRMQAEAATGAPLIEA